MKYYLLLILLLLPVICLARPLWSVDKGHTVVDHSLLDEVVATKTTQFSITADGEEFLVDVEKVSPPNLGVTSISGRINGHQESFFLLCRTDKGATIAFFRAAGGEAYRLDHTMGSDQVYAVEVGELGSCGGGLKPSQVRLGGEPHHPQPARPSANDDPSRSVADDGSRHDIVIGYTPAAESYMGGWDYIRAEAQLSVDAANLVYSNSNVASELRLVHIVFTDYEEISAWNYIDHVLYLLDPYDGYMDDMHQDRNLTGADFVSVLIDGRNAMGEVPTCGVARVMQSDEVNHDFEHLAFSIVSVQCAAANWSLAHEVGHNRGCAHDRNHAQVDGVFDYSYGHYFAFDEVEETGLRTVMSYDHFYFPHERVPYFSNPEVSFGGDATGVWPGLEGEAHNALTHDHTSGVCAAFRGERTFVQFSYPHAYSDGLILFPYPTIAEGLAGSLVGGNIVIQESKADFTGVFSEPRSYISDAVGGIVLGGF
jgi:hypothetical protein